MHSTASDGTCTPSELIEMASKLNLSAVSLTDHDTITGLPEFKSRADELGIIAVPGVEVAVNWNYKELHILGFWIDETCDELNSLLQDIRDNRQIRNDKIISKLQENGYEITMDEVKQVAKGESIGRPHLASILVDKGYFKTIKDVFSTCLARGGTGYMPRVLPDPKTTIDTIHKAKGLAFWAHPVHRSNANNKNILSDLTYFKELGLDGVEAYYSQFSQQQHEMLLKHADSLSMQVCGGSDFHGLNQPDILMGKGRGNLFVPESVYENLNNYYKSRYE